MSKSSSVLPLGIKAFVIVYDEDLSSKPLGFVQVDEAVLKQVEDAWLAIAIYEESGKCIEVVLSKGRRLEVRKIEKPFFVYPDRSSVLKKDLTRVVKVCSHG